MFRPVLCSNSRPAESYFTAGIVPMGSVVTFSSAGNNKVVAAKTANESTIGISVNDRQEKIGRACDGFYDPGEEIPVLTEGVGRAFVVPNAQDGNIDLGDFLEVCAFGSGATGTTGVLEEAGSQAGTVRTTTAVAQALEYVTMGAAGYKVPAQNVAIGDTAITMSTGDITTMGLEVGDLIVLEDLNGNAQMNAVKELTPTVITLRKPSTVALTAADSDLVHRVYQCKVKLL